MNEHLCRGETHVFEGDGRLILFDILGGSFFEIDGVTRDALDACDGKAPETVMRNLAGRHKPEEVLAALDGLKQAEVVTGEPLQVAPFHPTSQVEITHLALCLTRDEADGRSQKSVPRYAPTGLLGTNGLPNPRVAAKGRVSRGRTRDSQLKTLYMPEGVALGAVDFLLRASGCLRDCEISFEGGEPLLNLPLLRRVVAYGEERAGDAGKRMGFEVVTDGALLTRRIADDFAEKEIEVVLRVEGEGNPDVLRRAAAALEDYPHLTLQIVVNGQVPDLPGCTEALLRLFPSAASVGVRWAAGLLPERLDDAFAELEGVRRQTVRHVLSGEETVLEELEGPIAQLLERQVLLYGCGAGTRSAAVSPEGGLFPCFDLIGVRAFCAGDVFSGIDVERYRQWMQDLHAERRTPCRTCWARYLCGGGCWADAVLSTGDLATPNPVSCARIRRTYELAMAVCVEVEERSPGLLPARHLTGSCVSHEVTIADERPVLERYA